MVSIICVSLSILATVSIVSFLICAPPPQPPQPPPPPPDIPQEPPVDLVALFTAASVAPLPCSSATLNTPVNIPIEQENLSAPASSGVNSIIFSPPANFL